VDAELDLFDIVRISGMYGAGTIKDNYDGIGGTDYAYDGWEARVMVVAIRDVLEVGARYDCYNWDRAVVGGWTYTTAITIGANVTLVPSMRFQLNYKRKMQTGTTQLPDANVYLLSTQIEI